MFGESGNGVGSRFGRLFSARGEALTADSDDARH